LKEPSLLLTEEKGERKLELDLEKEFELEELLLEFDLVGVAE
jgi:hypothetical protein